MLPVFFHGKEGFFRSFFCQFAGHFTRIDVTAAGEAEGGLHIRSQGKDISPGPVADDRFREKASRPSDEIHVISHCFQYRIVRRAEDFPVVGEKGRNIVGLKKIFRFFIFIEDGTSADIAGSDDEGSPHSFGEKDVKSGRREKQAQTGHVFRHPFEMHFRGAEDDGFGRRCEKFLLLI